MKTKFTLGEKLKDLRNKRELRLADVSKATGISVSVSPKNVNQVAQDLGLSKNRLYAWRRKYTVDGTRSDGS
jgi:transcriptional regulator with XRE-family HTH domain